MRIIRLMPLAALVWAAGACSKDDGGTQPQAAALDKVTVTSSALSLQAGAQQTITASGVDQSNATLTDVTFTYTSASTNVALVSATGAVTGLSAGTSAITVTGTRAGVSKSTTVNVTVTGTLSNTASVVAGANSNDFTPSFLVVARGGTVSWTFPGRNHNVTFAATTGAPANIPTTLNSTTPISRTFTTAGTYDYNCTLHAGMTGTVIVP